MGSRPFPRGEKLKIIIEAIDKGLDYDEILKELNKWVSQELKENRGYGVSAKVGDRTLNNIKAVYEVTKEIVKTKIQQQLDPTLQKAREDHLNNIRAQIESWKGYICIRDIAAIDPSEYSSIPHSWKDLDNKPLFNALKQHLPFDELWTNWDAWKERYSKYLSQHEALREQILKDAKLVFNLPTYYEAFPEVKQRLVPHLTLAFEKPFFDAFADKANGREHELEELKFSPQPYPGPEKGMTLEGLHIGSHEVLIAENVKENCEPKYQKMLQDYLQKKEVANLIKLRDELRNATVGINATLNKILERWDYISYTCELCPGH